MRPVGTFQPKFKAVPEPSGVIIPGVFAGVIGLVLLVFGGRTLSNVGFTWGGVAMPAIGVLLLVLAVVTFRQLPLARELANSGAMTEGIVQGKWTKRNVDQDNTSSRDYYMSYSYGDGHHVSQKVSRKVYQSYDYGDPVDVRYLPRDPQRSRMVF